MTKQISSLHNMTSTHRACWTPNIFYSLVEAGGFFLLKWAEEAIGGQRHERAEGKRRRGRLRLGCVKRHVERERDGDPKQKMGNLSLLTETAVQEKEWTTSRTRNVFNQTAVQLLSKHIQPHCN